MQRLPVVAAVTKHQNSLPHTTATEIKAKPERQVSFALNAQEIVVAQNLRVIYWYAIRIEAQTFLVWKIVFFFAGSQNEMSLYTISKVLRNWCTLWEALT